MPGPPLLASLREVGCHELSSVTLQFSFRRWLTTTDRPSDRNTIFRTGIEYGIIKDDMETVRKITVEIPGALLEKAQQASGTGITQTIRTALQLLAASQAYDRLLAMRGKVRFGRTFEELKEDR
jgi:hypothetical protein